MSKKVPRKVPKKPVLGLAPTVPRDGALQILGCIPLSFAAGSVRLGRAPRFSQPRLGPVLQRRVGFALTRHPSYSLPL